MPKTLNKYLCTQRPKGRYSFLCSRFTVVEAVSQSQGKRLANSIFDKDPDFGKGRDYRRIEIQPLELGKTYLL